MKFWFLLLALTAGCAGVYRTPTLEELRQEYPQVTATPRSEDTSLNALDVEGCLRIALRENPDYRITSCRMAQAAAEIQKAQAAFFPLLNIRARYFHADSPATFFATSLDQRKFDLAGDLNFPDDFGSSRLSFNFDYRLNLGGAQILHSRIAEAESRISESEREKIRNILVSQVILAYYDTLAAEHFLEIAEQSVTTVSSQLKETRVKYAGGGALESDVLSLEVRLAETRENVVRAGNAYHLSLNALTYLLGLDPEVEITLDEKDWEPAELPATYEEGMTVALANRPELAQVRDKLLAASYRRDLSNTGYFPELEVYGSYYFEDRDFQYSSNRDDWTVGVALSWNVFDGFLTYANTVGAKAALEEMLVVEHKTVLSVKHEVDAAYRKWREAEERSRVLELAVQQAEENLDLVKNQFEGGAATITRYLDAELALTNVRFQLTSAFYDIKKAKALVGRSLGMCGLCSCKMEEKSF